MSIAELHRLMLRDRERNRHFLAAISQIVKTGDVVADLGAGTGFLSIAAARAGAKRVYAIEAADVFSLGEKIVRDNGLQKIVRFVHAPSTEVTLKEKVDVILTETFGSHPFEENTHEFVRDARERWLKPGGTVLPRAVSVFVAAASFEDQRQDWDLFAAPIDGVDFSRLREFTVDAMYANAATPDMLLGQGQLLERVQLGDKTKSRRTLTRELPISKTGVCSGLVQWFELDLLDGISLSTAPDKPPTHWRQIFYPLRAPLKVRAGEVLKATLHIDTRLEADLSVTWHVAQNP